MPKGKKLAFYLAPLVTIALVIFAVSASGRFPWTNATPTVAIAEVKTETPPPTLVPEETPTRTPTPIKCSDSDIVLGIFPQLAQESATSFAGASNAAIFCNGVYDLSHTEPLAVQIEYTAVDGSFAYFSIGFPEGHDISDFSEICVWVYAEESDQKFDLKIEDEIIKDRGSLITTTITNDWQEHCVGLDGYPGVNLEKITGITLSMNDSSGDAFIWVDDFEFR